MKFTLKDYQEDAVDDVLDNLKRARDNFKNPGKGEISSFSLTATTGAGKTVMAAAAIEALFWGNETFNFEPDPGAVVLWFSDDPSLNEQTRDRLMQASEKFNGTNLVRIEPPFAKPRLEPGKVYFLNTQKLSAKSLLVRGHVERDDLGERLPVPGTPDLQGWTIWETLANTIDAEDLTLYLVLDEAHRGFNTGTSRDKPTIVRRLVNGTRARPPMPIVWGISATISHFEQAMKDAEATRDRRALPPVLVAPWRVQESGLVKDTLVLDIPDEAGNFDSVLVRRAANKLKDSTTRWAAYAGSQGLLESVQPLLVLQTPNTPNPDDVGIALDTIFDAYPNLREGQVRHVLGDHTQQKFGAWAVDWIEPQRVQDDRSVRILIAKDAISTGWDCPRAEVLVSFRPAKDTTHITQLLGRMIRSPLARRVPGDERLNAVDCILPFFDRTTAVKVVKHLTGQLDEIPGGNGKKVVLDGRDLLPNPAIRDAVWQLWETLPTQTMPQRGARPVKRLVALAQALSATGVRPGAVEHAERELHQILDGYGTRYGTQLDAAVKDVWAVHVKEITGRYGEKGLSYQEFVERADDRAIRSGFELAKKAFGADIALSYVNHLAGPDDASADDDGLRDAYVRATALAAVKEVREKVDAEALELTTKLFAEHRVALKELPDEQQQAFEDIRAMATDPQVGTLSRPRTRVEGFSVEVGDDLHPAPVVPLHLMADEDGNFPLTALNDWERHVVQAEIARDSIRGWYRNPSRPAVDSLGIAYRDPSGNWRSMHPDFVFFHEVQGEVKASIVDPHGHHLDDAGTKLQALARFAAQFGDRFHRIEALSEVNGHMRVLDLTRQDVRDAVLHDKKPVVDFYWSQLAVNYEPTHANPALF